MMDDDDDDDDDDDPPLLLNSPVGLDDGILIGPPNGLMKASTRTNNAPMKTTSSSRLYAGNEASGSRSEGHLPLLLLVLRHRPSGAWCILKELALLQRLREIHTSPAVLLSPSVSSSSK